MLEGLRVKETGSDAERLEVLVREHSAAMGSAAYYAPLLGRRADAVAALLETLGSQGAVVSVGGGRYVHQDYARDVKRRALNLLTAFHKQQPLKGGMKREELRSRLLPQADIAQVDALIDHFIAQKAMKEVRGLISVQSFKVELGEELEKLTAELEKWYREAAFAPPATDEVTEKYKKHKQIAQVLSAMIGDGVLVRLDAQIYMHRRQRRAGGTGLPRRHGQSGQMTLAEFRDLLGTSLQVAVALLEHFDRQKVTKKVGDARVLV